MYDELVKVLRNNADHYGFVGENGLVHLLTNAADAIEELQHHVFLADLACKAEAAKAPRWIPVSERLPENLTSVIVHRKDGGIFTWEYFNTSPTDECWIDDSMNVYSFYDVTHWMPLPPPAEEG